MSISGAKGLIKYTAEIKSFRYVVAVMGVASASTATSDYSHRGQSGLQSFCSLPPNQRKEKTKKNPFY